MRNERGTLIELNILIAVLILGALLGLGMRSWWKGFVYAALGLFGVLAVLVALGLLLGWLDRQMDLGPVRKVLDSAPVRWLRAAFAYLAGGVAFGAPAAFAAIFVAPHLSAAPQGQLLAMQAITAAGVLAGFALVFSVRREGPRF
jgi:hypothetical protein